MPRLFSRRRALEAEAGRLYCAIVARARRPGLYRDLGVADTLDGRFEMLALHVALLLRRLKELGEGELAQSVVDNMFADLDQALREIGVGDISVAKKIRPMAEAFRGRAAAYGAALDAADGDVLARALARNVFPEEAAPPAAVPLARYVRRLADRLGALTPGEIGADPAGWPEPAAEP
jgi:cytochrome b pre-mRNA-processing protein 3